MINALETGDSLRVGYLLGRIADGDQEALGELYDLTVEEIYVHYRSATSSLSARKLTHDTFMNIWVNAALFPGSDHDPMVWIRRVAFVRSYPSRCGRAAFLTTGRDLRVLSDARSSSIDETAPRAPSR